MHGLKRDARAQRRSADDWTGLLRRGELTQGLARLLWVGVTDAELKILFGMLKGLGN
jgi:hypothetical protein